MLSRLIGRGIVERVKRGVYRISDNNKINVSKEQEIIDFSVNNKNNKENINENED
jgi:predicted transcriptional regulator of viral defense system